MPDSEDSTNETLGAHDFDIQRLSQCTASVILRSFNNLSRGTFSTCRMESKRYDSNISIIKYRIYGSQLVLSSLHRFLMNDDTVHLPGMLSNGLMH
jgi:hypothetical protein